MSFINIVKGKEEAFYDRI